MPRTLAPGPNATEYEYAEFPCELPRNSAMRPLAGGWHLDVVPVSAAGFRAASEPEPERPKPQAGTASLRAVLRLSGLSRPGPK